MGTCPDYRGSNRVCLRGLLPLAVKAYFGTGVKFSKRKTVNEMVGLSEQIPPCRVELEAQSLVEAADRVLTPQPPNARDQRGHRTEYWPLYSFTPEHS